MTMPLIDNPKSEIEEVANRLYAECYLGHIDTEQWLKFAQFCVGYRNKFSGPSAPRRERELLQRIVNAYTDVYRAPNSIPTPEKASQSLFTAWHALTQSIESARQFLAPAPTLCKHCGDELVQEPNYRLRQIDPAWYHKRTKEHRCSTVAEPKES
jgi:hypothetical protein